MARYPTVASHVSALPQAQRSLRSSVLDRSGVERADAWSSFPSLLWSVAGMAAYVFWQRRWTDQILGSRPAPTPAHQVARSIAAGLWVRKVQIQGATTSQEMVHAAPQPAAKTPLTFDRLVFPQTKWLPPPNGMHTVRVR